MTSSERIIEHTMLKALLNLHGNAEALLKFVAFDKQVLHTINLPKSIAFKELLDPKQWHQTIHYSWFIPFLKQLPPALAATYILLFNPAEQKALAQLLACQPRAAPLTTFSELLLLSHLKQAIGAKDILPIALLPPSKFGILFKVSEKTLLLLIDLLSLHDLAIETKQIVDKQTLARLESCLTEQEKLFLNHFRKQVIRYIPPKLNLAKWDGNAESLRAQLHTRGIIRLAKATVSEGTSFCWHLTHYFDVNRGKILVQTYQETCDPALTSYFQKQVLELIERLNK